MASTPSYAASPMIGMVQISTANTNRDGTGSAPTVCAGVTGGRRVTRVLIQATGTTTAGMVRLYVYDGTDTRMIGEVVVGAITPSGTEKAWSAVLEMPQEFALPSSSWELKASTHNAETFNVVAFGDDP